MTKWIISSRLQGGSVLTNYLKVALRNLVKHRLYSFINIGGLAIGLACAILISLWVRDELSFDRFHKYADSIYRVNWDFKWEGNEGIGPGTPPPLAATLLRNIPDVNAAVRLRRMPSAILRVGDKSIVEDGVVAADSSFFEIFSFPLLSGDPSTALKLPNSVVLTKSLSAILFGNESPLGKSILIDDNKVSRFGRYQNLFTVTGVVQDPPSNSHIQFSMLTSMSSYPEVAWFNWSWVWMQVVTYVRLQDGAQAASIDAQIPDLVKRFAAAGFKRVGMSYDQVIKSGGRWNFVLQPLTNIYLGSAGIGNRLGPIGDRSQVVLFSFIALFILGIACINFMNITTARSMNRAKEIGVRKVLGSDRKSLMTQFLIESCLSSFVAMPVALFLVELSIVPFDHLSGKTLEFSLVDPAWLPAALILLTVTVGLVSGLYPGLYLSSFNPAQTVKGVVGSSTGGKNFRNALVVTQFAITIGLMTCTLLVKKQMDYIREKDLGFEKRNVVVISNENNRLGVKSKAFRDALLNQPQVINASLANGVPPGYGFQDSYAIQGKEESRFELNSYMGDDNFIATMGISIVHGRGFSREFDDSSSVILNESAVRMLGLSNPLGTVIDYPGGNGAKYRVVGVMKDFNVSSLYSPIAPFALFSLSSKSYTIPSSYVIVRVHKDNLSGTLQMLQSEWKMFAPSTPFEYTFLDETIETQYRSAERLGQLFLVFSVLTILIACIGLFGLATFATERRTKEIGIRKVLGASEAEVVGVLSKDFLILVLMANVIACPVSWYIMKNWLQTFAYRADIGWLVFAVSGGMALFIAMLTVSFQAIKAALANPVEAMRYE